MKKIFEESIETDDALCRRQISDQLIKDVESAIRNVMNDPELGPFKVKQSDKGTDRVANMTLRLTSKDWNKDAQIRFSIDMPSEYVGDANDPIYYAACEMAVRTSLYDSFVGTKHSIDMSGKPARVDVGRFIEDLFLPTAIKILKFAKANKRNYPSIDLKKFKEFFKGMFYSNAITAVPSYDQISQLFIGKQSNESILKEESNKSMKTYNTDYALNNYVESLMDKSGFKGNSYFVLSLGERSSFYSLKDFVIKVYGNDALDVKPGIHRYFILFKNMDKKEIVDKMNIGLDMFGSYWEEDDIKEFNRNGTIYYITRLVFED